MKNKPFRFLSVLALCAFAGCSQIESAAQKTAAFVSSPQVQKTIAAVELVAQTALDDYLAGGGHISNAQAASLGLQSATSLAPSITTSAQLQSLIISTATAWAGDPKLKQPIADVAKIAAKQLPANPTPAQVTQTLSGAGIALSNVANTANTP